MRITMFVSDTDRLLRCVPARWSALVRRAIAWERARQRTLTQLESYRDHELVEWRLESGDRRDLAARTADMSHGPCPPAPARVLAAIVLAFALR